MIFPSTYEVTLLLVALAAIAWGLWASTFRLAGGNWRFELYYFDFGFGTLLAATVAALTFGSMGLELTFWDNLTLTASKRMMMWALVAGVVFNLGNMLLMASVSISGIATSFTIGLGTAMLVDRGAEAITGVEGSLALRAAAGLAVLAAMILLGAAHRGHAALQAQNAKPLSAGETDPAAGPTTPVAAAMRQRRLGPEPKADKDAEGTPLKGILLALCGGLLIGAVPRLVSMTSHPEMGVGPYALVFLMSFGIFFSTLVFNLYFLNLPVKGAPLPFFRYLQGSFRQHMAGILGGMLWVVGTACSYIAFAAPRNLVPSTTVLQAPFGAGVVLAVIAGVVAWKEFAGASGALKGMVGLGILLLAAGAALFALAAGV